MTNDRAEAEAELRAEVSASLRRLDDDYGGRHLGRVAAALGVHRSTVSRWRSGVVSPSFDRCVALARHYPDHFDEAQLVRLLTNAALGGDGAGVAGPASIHAIEPSFPAMVEALTAAIEREPSDPADREVLHISLEAEAEQVPEPGETVFDSPDDFALRLRFQDVMDRRAREGWRMRMVMNAAGPYRLHSLQFIADRLAGPDVEIRAYATSVPLVVSQFVIARREVLAGFNGGRQARPTPALLRLESPEAVAWSTRYFDDLFADAPFRVRTPEGVSAAEFDRLREAIDRLS